MRYLIDTHVHVYPFHDVRLAFASLMENMPAGDAATVRVACLTERHDCSLYQDIAAGRCRALETSFDVVALAPTVLRLTHRSSGQRVLVVAGQQVVTNENIEILALGMRERVAERRDAVATVNAILANGGLPVIAWAPGKWFFSRGRVVKELLRCFNPHQIALGDTSLRPIGWMTPSIMRLARRRGFRVLSGSDPLPAPGEERRLGTCYSKLEDAAVTEDSLVSGLLSAPPTALRVAGTRQSPVAVARRMVAHRRASRAAAGTF